MNYEPRGKVGKQLEAMRAQADRVWTAAEMAASMQIPKSAVPAHVDAAIRHAALHRKTEGGQSWYSLKPFSSPVVPGSRSIFERESTASGWRPPAMTPSRQIPAEPAREPLPPPLKQQPEPVASVVPVTAVPKPEPSAPTARMTASLTTAKTKPEEQLQETEAETEAEAEPVEFDACVFLDGRMQVWGGEENEDGSRAFTPAQVMQLRAMLAWRQPAGSTAQ